MTTQEKNNIIERYGDKISSLAHRMIWNKNIAQEATQEVWYEVLKSINSFNHHSQLSTWIYTIAKRTILKYAQNERTLKKHEFEHHFNQAPINYNGNEENRLEWVKEKCDYCLTAFCHCLPNDARLIFLFRDLAELNDTEIATIMELKVENIRKIASRSKEKVKSFMRKDCILMNDTGKCRCRIQKEIKHVKLDDAYRMLSKAVRLIDLFDKFDKELPRKNYWLKYVSQDVTD